MPKQKNICRHRQMSIPLFDEEVECLNEIKKTTGQAKSCYVAQAIREKLVKDSLLDSFLKGQ